jgi:hypothetical protein
MRSSLFASLRDVGELERGRLGEFVEQAQFLVGGLDRPQELRERDPVLLHRALELDAVLDELRKAERGSAARNRAEAGHLTGQRGEGGLRAPRRCGHQREVGRRALGRHAHAPGCRSGRVYGADGTRRIAMDLYPDLLIPTFRHARGLSGQPLRSVAEPLLAMGRRALLRRLLAAAVIHVGDAG